MTVPEFARLRSGNHRLIAAQYATPAEVVGWFGAVQAQGYALARRADSLAAT